MNIISSQIGKGNNTKTVIDNFSEIVFNLESKPNNLVKIIKNKFGIECYIANNKLILQDVYEPVFLKILLNLVIILSLKNKIEL